MHVVVAGGGVAGLSFALLCRKALPNAQVQVFDRRNAPPKSGVVFSPEAIELLDTVDSGLRSELLPAVVPITALSIQRGEEACKSSSFGLVGLSGEALWNALRLRCASAGVTFEERPFFRLADLPTADLVVAADGEKSPLREELSAHLRPSIEYGRNHFSWVEAPASQAAAEENAFQFHFVPSPRGLLRIHTYPFAMGRWAWIAERPAGPTDAALESGWKPFATVRCEKWFHDNVALLGDAAHTTHFSIGMGTRLALEDSIALAKALQQHPERSDALSAYQAERKPRVERAQRTAEKSARWFENAERYLDQPLPQFTFNLLTRTGRLGYDDIRTQNPELVASFSPQDAPGVPPMFAPLSLRSLSLSNRVVVSPMCQYRAHEGLPNDWHLVHLGSRAVGGAGLLVAEKTAISAEGRITRGCTGIYNDDQSRAWKRIVDFVHQESDAKIGLQLGHAGRKASCAVPWEGGKPLTTGGWQTLGPSANPFESDWPVPTEMTEADVQRVISQYVQAARRAEAAGFDLLELHAAHGYLLSSFLSPLVNRRTDRYGGSLQNRMSFLLAVFEAVRTVWPSHKPIAVRLSATDWLEPRGMTVDDAVQVASALKSLGVDLIDVSSAGNVPESRPIYGRMYQVPFAEEIRSRAQVPVMAVGGISTADQVNTVLSAGRADLCAIARGHLSDPYLTYRAAQAARHRPGFWPKAYLTVRP